MESDYKSAGTGIITFGLVAGQIKRSGFDLLGKWTYKLSEEGDWKHYVIFTIYNCLKTPSQTGKKTTLY